MPRRRCSPPHRSTCPCRWAESSCPPWRSQSALSKPVVPMFSNQMARRFMLMPAAPKMQNHSTAYRKGKGHMTPCLMVHPREMRAMKASTRGAQAIHFGALAVFRLLSQCRVGKGCDVEGNRDEVVQATVRTIRLRGCTRAHPVQMQTSSPPCRIPRCVKRLS